MSAAKGLCVSFSSNLQEFLLSSQGQFRIEFSVVVDDGSELPYHSELLDCVFLNKRTSFPLCVSLKVPFSSYAYNGVQTKTAHKFRLMAALKQEQSCFCRVIAVGTSNEFFVYSHSSKVPPKQKSATKRQKSL
jgi:hypothetical protein